MLINSDFSCRAALAGDEYQWVASPQSGVERVMLDRLGGEKARATSIVRYAPSAGYPEHPHPGGEEILVLSGTFSEGQDHYPAGWYLRNPPGSSHQPSTLEGATIFVKLWQMPADEMTRVRIDTRLPTNWQLRDGRQVCPLFSQGSEAVSLQRLEPGEVLFTGQVDSAELLILEGGVVEEQTAYGKGSWMRLPKGTYPHIQAGVDGATIYLKTGHLAPVSSEA